MQVHIKNHRLVFALFFVLFFIVFGGYSHAQNIKAKVSVEQVADAELSRLAEFFAAEIIAKNPQLTKANLKNAELKIEIIERTYMEKTSFKNSISGIAQIVDANGKLIGSGSFFADGKKTVVSAGYLQKIVKSLLKSLKPVE